MHLLLYHVHECTADMQSQSNVQTVRDILIILPECQYGVFINLNSVVKWNKNCNKNIHSIHQH